MQFERVSSCMSQRVVGCVSMADIPAFELIRRRKNADRYGAHDAPQRAASCSYQAPRSRTFSSFPLLSACVCVVLTMMSSLRCAAHRASHWRAGDLRVSLLLLRSHGTEAVAMAPHPIVLPTAERVGAAPNCRQHLPFRQRDPERVSILLLLPLCIHPSIHHMNLMVRLLPPLLYLHTAAAPRWRSLAKKSSTRSSRT